MNWWIVPGIAVVAMSLAMTLLNLLLTVFGYRRYELAVRAIFVRRVGIGLLFLGLGIGWMLPALGRGPDVGGLIVGALAAGMGGLYFISVTDPMFKGGPLLGWPLRKSKGKAKDPEDHDPA